MQQIWRACGLQPHRVESFKVPTDLAELMRKRIRRGDHIAHHNKQPQPVTLMLDESQRLNPHTLLGSQRGDVATIRALWALQDKIALTAEEEKGIELKHEVVAGQERTNWKPALAHAQGV